MASASRPLVPAAYLSRADQLKRELADFVTSGPLKNEYERQRKVFFEIPDPDDWEESATIRDWFMFDWFDESGLGVIDRFLEHHTHLNERDQEILSDWEDSIHSIFEVRSVARNKVNLRDLDGSDTFIVSTVAPASEIELESRQFIAARLLPLSSGFIFAG